MVISQNRGAGLPRRPEPVPDDEARGGGDERWAACRRAIENAVSVVFGIEQKDIRLATRGCPRAALARQAAMYLAHVALRMSYTDVGLLFSRDRTTVAHGCAVVEDRRDDPRFDRVMDLLEVVACALLAAHDPSRAKAH